MRFPESTGPKLLKGHDPEPRLVTFDIFDTCLVRSCRSPEDVQLLVGRRLPGGSDPVFVAEYVRRRGEAERAALAASDLEDVRFEEIFDRMGGVRDGMDPAACARLEMEVEDDLLNPVAATRLLVEECRAAGIRVAYVSDMYLPSGFLARILSRHGFLREGDGLYVSGEIGKRKSTGSLFRHVQEVEGIRPDRWIHVGDHPASDQSIPRSMGIGVHPVEPPAWSRYERAILDLPLAFPASLDAGLCAGISRAIRAGDRLDDGLSTVAAGCAGPLLAFFTASVLRDARAKGLSRLLFLARDGHILHRIARTLQEDRSGPELGYLCLSRRTLYFPTILEGSRVELAEILHAGRGRSPRTNFLSLGIPDSIFLDHHEAAGLPASFFDRPLDEAGMESLLSFLALPGVVDHVRRAARERRELLLDYLEQEGALAPGAALVDSGWGLASQKFLRRMLRAAGRPVPDFRYLCVLERRKSLDEAGPFQAGFVPELQPTHDRRRLVLDSQALIEQAFFATRLGSTVGLERDGAGRVVPVFGAVEHPDDGNWIERIQETAVAWARALRRFPELADSPEPWLEAMGWNGLAIFWRHPRRGELGWLDGVRVNEIGGGLGDDRTFVARIPLRELLVFLAKPSRRLDAKWEAGSLLLSCGPGPTRWIVRWRGILSRFRESLRRIPLLAGRS